VLKIDKHFMKIPLCSSKYKSNITFLMYGMAEWKSFLVWNGRKFEVWNLEKLSFGPLAPQKKF